MKEGCVSWMEAVSYPHLFTLLNGFSLAHTICSFYPLHNFKVLPFTFDCWLFPLSCLLWMDFSGAYTRICFFYPLNNLIVYLFTFYTRIYVPFTHCIIPKFYLLPLTVYCFLSPAEWISLGHTPAYVSFTHWIIS